MKSLAKGSVGSGGVLSTLRFRMPNWIPSGPESGLTTTSKSVSS